MISENDIQDCLGHADIERAIAWEMQRETLAYYWNLSLIPLRYPELVTGELAIQNLNLAISRGI